MFELKFPSQRLAYPFFVTMLIFFLVQIVYGLTMALQQMDPYFLQGIANFNVNRASHTNLAITWVLTGIIGSLIYIGPLLAGRELARPWMARFLLIALWGVVIWNTISFPMAQSGNAGWAFGQAWFQTGLEFLDTGLISKIVLLVGFLILAYLILGIFPRIQEWNEIHWALAIGLSGLVVFWLFGMFFIPELDLQEFFRWFVVHYWVEAIWEILYVALVSFMLYAFFGGDLKVIGFAGFWSVTMIVMSGLIGNGHHYFWIGTPAFWQFWGSLFSALEPLPIIFGIWHVFVNSKNSRKPLTNTPAFYFIFGSALLELVGAGLLGFTQTFSLTNVWEHGTWVTPGHAHLALFGTFGMLMIGSAYAVIPMVKGIARFEDRVSKTAFWIILTGILGMMLSFTLGGTTEIYIYRILGLDWFGAEVRPAMELWKGMLFIFGGLFASGVVTMAYDLLTLKPRAETTKITATSFGWWQRPLSVLEASGWLAALVFIGFLLTFGLFSNNLTTVRLGDPTIPYTVAGIGYPALALVTLAFALRFLRSFEGQQATLGSKL